MEHARIGVTGQASSMTEYQGGLVVGGDIIAAGDQTAYHVARWDGAARHALGVGFGAYLGFQQVKMIGTVGGQLYAGGAFYLNMNAIDPRSTDVARWGVSDADFDRDGQPSTTQDIAANFSRVSRGRGAISTNHATSTATATPAPMRTSTRSSVCWPVVPAKRSRSLHGYVPDNKRA